MGSFYIFFLIIFTVIIISHSCYTSMNYTKNIELQKIIPDLQDHNAHQANTWEVKYSQTKNTISSYLANYKNDNNFLLKIAIATNKKSNY